MIRVEDVFVVFCGGTPLERIALRGINFNVNESEVVSIIGNNGSGRSTLLRFLAGHITSSFGRVWLDKIDITRQSLAERSNYVSAVFYDETIGSAGNLTLLENLVMASMHHQSRSIFYPAIDEAMREIFFQQLKELDFMGMEELLDEKVCNLSKTQRYVLSLLIAVIKEAKLLLIDEHSTGLDKESADALQEVTNKIIKSKKIMTIMAVSDPKIALEVSDRAIVLSRGQIVMQIDTKNKSKIKIEDIYNSFNIDPIVRGIK